MARKRPMALTLGRDVWFLRREHQQPAAIDVLLRAYERIGRRAFADILRVHAAHRDLASVEVYA